MDPLVPFVAHLYRQTLVDREQRGVVLARSGQDLHRIVQNHGGSLTAESTPGEGSTFTVRIPLNARPPERDDTLIYPGHDYLLNNLGFTLDREPDNAVAKQMLADYENQDPNDALVTTLAQERQMNTFFRLDSPSVIAKLQQDFPEIGDAPDQRTVFLKLRELRNSW